MTTLNDLAAKRAPDFDAVSAHRKAMLGEVRAYRLREMREQFNLTQTEMASELHISQKRVSGIERGDLEKTQVDTLRKYVEALGGKLSVSVELGDSTYTLAS